MRLAELYTTYPRLEKEEEGIELWREARRLAESIEGWDRRDDAIRHISFQIAEAYVLMGRYAEAVPEYQRALAAAKGRDTDGASAFVHGTQDQMPLRIAIKRPRRGAKDGSSSDARSTAIEAVQLWENAIRPWLPWFQLEFVEKDPTAPVQVEWSWGRSAGGSAAGRGAISWEAVDGDLRVGGWMKLAIQPGAPYSTRTLTLDEIKFLVAHEFGHVLGLAHCLDCDSAMNYSWETRERIFVTGLDVLTFRALLEKSNGHRVDGLPLKSLRRHTDR